MLPTERQKLEESLTSKLNAELTQLKQLQVDNESKRKAEIESTIERKHNSLVEVLLTQRELDKQEREREKKEREETRRWYVTKVVLPLGFALISALGGGAYWNVTHTPDPAQVVEDSKAAVKSAVDGRLTAVEDHLDRNDKKIQRTVEMLQDQQVQLSESVDYIGDKIEAVHPRAARVDVPPAVESGRKAAAAIKDARGAEGPTYDPADPLGDLEKKP